MPEMLQGNDSKRLARLGDRFLAFLFDLSLFSIAYYLSVAALLFGLNREPGIPIRIILAVLWYAAFSLYHAWMASRSGATMGKRLLGIALIDARTGIAPTFGAAMARAWCYLLSSLPLNLGFLWALVHSESRAWHDLLAGTFVIETREKGVLPRFLASSAAVAASIFIALSWVWFYVAGPKFYELQKISNAQGILDSLASMQEDHKKTHGKYTDDLTDLANMTDNGFGFMDHCNEVLDIKAGFEMKVDDSSYRIIARARDKRSTRIEIFGPQRRRRVHFLEEK